MNFFQNRLPAAMEFIIDVKRHSWYFIFDKNGNYLKANLLSSRDTDIFWQVSFFICQNEY